MQLKTLDPLLVPPSAALSAAMLQVPCVTFHLAAPLSKSSISSVPSGVTTIGLPPLPVAPALPVAPPPLPVPAAPVVPAVPGLGFEAPPPEPQAIVNRARRLKTLGRAS